MDNEEQRKRTHRRRLWLLIGGIVLSIALTAVLISSVLSFVWKLSDKYALDEKTRTYLEAIIAEDDELLHTVSYDEDVETRALIDALREEGIELQGEVRVKKSMSFSIRTLKGVTTADARFQVTVGSERYIVTIEYRKDALREGIQSFWIKPKD